MLFAQSWRSSETLAHQLRGPPKLLSHMNGWSWVMLHNFLNPPKQATATQGAPIPPDHLLSGHRPGTSSSQPRFTAWLHLGISKPTTTNSHLRLLYRSGRVAPGKTQVEDDLGLHYPGKPRPAYPVDNYRPRQSNTTLPLHS